MNTDLIIKYNVPGPRYTSYPTVPFWKDDTIIEQDWLSSIHQNIKHNLTKDISLYIHLPYCESLCTFCGCHKRITKNHAVEDPYISAVKKEWDLYQSKLNIDFNIKELHLGGGTPTFFSPENLIGLLGYLFKTNQIDPKHTELSFEAHPNNTSDAHLQKLFDFGFRRLSLGIQDYDPVVQKAIHRIQSVEQVKKVHDTARNMGYTSISHDLVFGLPKQKLENFLESIRITIDLKPDRIALYSYAHVPWVKGTGQRGFDENDLPDNQEKRTLYVEAKRMLIDAGYVEIGMDHFALPKDSLAIAYKNKDLHRNFMGYTTSSTKLLIGLGMSAISDSWYGFAQNEKTVERYIERINQDEIPIFRGHFLTKEEEIIRQHILDLMCHFETEIPTFSGIYTGIIHRLSPLYADGLIRFEDKKLRITELGLPFVRNVCMAFDLDLANRNKNEQLFSKTI